MWLFAACRKMVREAHDGAARDAMRSRRTAPGPMLGSWSYVAHEDEARARRDGLRERVGELEIDHGGFVDDDRAGSRWGGSGRA